MGTYSDRLSTEVRLERMRPDEVDAAKAQRAVIYLPFGSIEWHGRQNPVGLDAIKAHEQLVVLAARCGGVVYPPVFFGSGGGHCDYPSSFMVSAGPMIEIVTDLLAGFERDGYCEAILLSGHYPNKDMYLRAAVDAYREAGGTMRVLTLVECEAPGVGGDHAAHFETSAMLHLHPDTVCLEALGPVPPGGVSDEPQNWMDETFADHPCYGILGCDPRGRASAEAGKVHTDRLIEFLAQWLDGGDPPSANGWLLDPDSANSV